jgi:hypothetical protein
VSNTMTNYIPQILAMGMVALRENSIMARLVNRAYDPNPGTKGSTVDVPIPSACTAEDVVPATTGQAVTAISPTTVPIALSQWKQSGFAVTDKERTQIADGAIPMQLTECARVLANAVDAYILGKYPGIYGAGGTAGTTPFASTMVEATQTRTELTRNLCPPSDRFCVIDADAEGAALNLTAFHSASETGQSRTYVEGFISRVMGADWHTDQNMPYHTAGTLANGSSTKVVAVTTAVAIALSTFAVDAATLTGTIVIGDIFSRVPTWSPTPRRSPPAATRRWGSPSPRLCARPSPTTRSAPSGPRTAST